MLSITRLLTFLLTVAKCRIVQGERRLYCACVSDLTRIHDAVKHGDKKAVGELLPQVYLELRRLAAQKMAHEAPGQTLQPTALVHEAWLRLGADAQPQWESRAHFFAAAAEAMRRILIECARRKQRVKHGGHLERVNADEVDLPMELPMEAEDLVRLDEALDRLTKVNGRATEVVNLCFFLGLTHEEAARELGVSLSTVERLWSFSRAWLFGELRNAT